MIKGRILNHGEARGRVLTLAYRTLELLGRL